MKNMKNASATIQKSEQMKKEISTMFKNTSGIKFQFKERWDKVGGYEYEK